MPLDTIKPTKEVIEDTSSNDFLQKALNSEARVRTQYPKQIISDVDQVSEKIRQCLIDQSCSCNYCGELFVGGNYEIDHVHPLVLGGMHSTDNLQLLCVRCNRSKGSRTEAEFLGWIQKISMFQWSKTEGAQAKAEKMFIKSRKYHKHKKKKNP